MRRSVKKAVEKQQTSFADMSTLHSLGVELPGFFHYVHTFPTLAVVVGEWYSKLGIMICDNQNMSICNLRSMQ